MSTDAAGAVRIEHDLLGDHAVPADAYYGVHTARAMENFPISAVPISTHPDLVVALASVKQAAAESNRELGLLDPPIADAIITACTEIRSGSLHEQFVVDQIQGGAGTSTNMNANEVIANRALELLGHSRGEYQVVHPLEHVNLGQSTNDVYPTAVKVALGAAASDLSAALRALATECSEKSLEFGGILKLGRTQLQDAVPMTLGQEFGAFAVTIGEDADRIDEAISLIAEINLGGTAIGISGKDGNLIEAQQLKRTKKDPDSNIERVLDLGFVGEPEQVASSEPLTLFEIDALAQTHQVAESA